MAANPRLDTIVISIVPLATRGFTLTPWNTMMAMTVLADETAAYSLALAVDLVEPLGSETLLHGRLASAPPSPCSFPGWCR